MRGLNSSCVIPWNSASTNPYSGFFWCPHDLAHSITPAFMWHTCVILVTRVSMLRIRLKNASHPPDTPRENSQVRFVCEIYFLSVQHLTSTQELTHFDSAISLASFVFAPRLSALRAWFGGLFLSIFWGLKWGLKMVIFLMFFWFSSRHTRHWSVIIECYKIIFDHQHHHHVSSTSLKSKKGRKMTFFGRFSDPQKRAQNRRFLAVFDIIENTRKITSKVLSTHVFYKIDRFLNFGKNWKKIFENWQEITGNYCIIIWGGCKIPDPVPKTKGFWSSPYGLSKQCPQITLYLVRAPKN